MFERRGHIHGLDTGNRTRVEDWVCGQATPQVDTQSVSTCVLRWRDYAYSDLNAVTEPTGVRLRREVHGFEG